ncbi:hypothetical protein [Pseudotabrizicola algicola]|nr:hypothetical protein [Pseudotabrizicola algicola]
MAQELMQASQTAPHVAGFDVVTPLSSRTLFWRPRYLRDGASLHHLPFLFWLVDTLRPKSFVSLGGGDGVVHFALCQAAEKLDLDARGYSFGPWGTESGSVPTDLARYNSETYPDGSRLSPSDPAQAAGSFPAGTVDLLSVQLGDHAEAGAAEARVRDWIDRDWSHRMSARGVMVFHGVNAALEQGGDEGFLARLKGLHPTFHLDTGEGLLVVLRGAQPEDRLARLCKMAIGDPGYAAVLHVFGRLGSAAHAEMSARHENLRAEELQQRLEKAEQTLSQSRAAGEETRAALARLNEAYDERNRQIAVIQGKMLDLQVKQGDMAAAAEALSTELAESKANLAAAAAREAELAVLVDKRTAELAALDALRADLETAQNKQTWLRKERERLQAEEAELRRALDSAAKEAQERKSEAEARTQAARAEAEAHAETIATLTRQLEQSHAEAEARTQAARAEAEEHADTIASLTRQLEQSHAEAEARTQAARAEAEEHADTIASLTRQLEQSQTEAEARLQSLNDARAAEAQSQADTIATLTRQLEQSRIDADARLHALTQDRDARAAEVQAQAEAIATLTQQLETVTIGHDTRYADLARQHQETQQAAQALSEERAALAAELEAARAEIAAASEQFTAIGAQLATQAAQTFQARRDHDQIRAEHALTLRQVQDLSAQLDTAQREAAARAADVLSLEAELREVKDRLAQNHAREARSLVTLTAELEKHQIAADQHRAVQDTLAALQAAYATQEQRLSLQEAESEKLRALLSDQAVQTDRLRAKANADRAALRAERDAARAHAKAQEDRISAVLNSTSWKLTGPVRKALETVRGK